MTAEDISKIRLAKQQIKSKKFSNVKELVGYMGALQAQDYSMSKWAVGVRLKNADEQLVISSIDKGDILRTHLLRPTWHLVSSDDIYWMLDLTASRIKNSMRSRNKELGLTAAIFRKSNRIIRDALAGNNHLTRGKLIQILRSANLKTDQNRASHLLMEAELDGIICSGKYQDDKPTYALLEERVEKRNYLSREESFVKLASIYFTSRGPATLNDFAWWSGLTISDARAAIEMIKLKMKSFQLGAQTYWYLRHSSENLNQSEQIFLLPAYDEFIISYKDRSAVIISDSDRKIISANGIFRAIVVHRGKIIGTWKRTARNSNLLLEIEYLSPQIKKIKNLVNDAAENFGLFTGKRIRKIDHKSIDRK